MDGHWTSTDKQEPSINLDDLLENIQRFKAVMPKRYEIWLTKLAIERDEKGEPCITVLDIEEMDKALHDKSNYPFAFKIPTRNLTHTGASHVILIHPNVWLEAALKHPFLYDIPVIVK